ncbi:recombinase family protein [Desulforhopalus singaporensis]|uniref:Site-specific DNA recombinase n=1 Tax=Desulforhopalus singaporensis TaxID=91360 RepID=A0A1H0VQ46_9BACT|nr:recombinase family protein [Desulforhopalus singaporensis]SDP80570.1 Site-specific DNA recombinase [Desulforhopalus singaporensis]
MEKVYGYVRVSTQKQGDGVSLIEQKSAIEDFAKKNNLTIIHWFEEKVTAAKEGRPAFNEMMALLTREKAEGACFHKIDRSSRNYGDWNRINILADAGINFYSVSDGINLSDESSRLPADILAAMSTHYIRNLRKEVLKGFYGRLKQGFYPLPAPIGYKDMGGGKTKEIDLVYGPLVRKTFELYCTGKYGIISLTEEMNKRGLRGRKGGKVTKTGIANILRNPFYIGMMKIKRTDEVFAGSHKPIVSKVLFNKTQQILDGRTHKRVIKHDFHFKRMLKCAHCKYSIIGERQKGHIYYRCHTKGCPTKTIRQEIIENVLRQFSADIALTGSQLDEIREIAQKSLEKGNDFRNKTITELKFKKTVLDDKLDKLTDAVIDGLIDRDIYLRKKEKIIFEQVELQSKIEQLNEKQEVEDHHVDKFLELLKTACIKENQLELADLSHMVNFATSNLFLNGKYIEIKTYSPFTEVLRNKKSTYCPPCRDRPRTAVANDTEDGTWVRYRIDIKKQKTPKGTIDLEEIAKSLIRSMATL